MHSKCSSYSTNQSVSPQCYSSHDPEGHFNNKNNFLNYASLKRHFQFLEAHRKRIRLLKSVSSSASLKDSLEKNYLSLFSSLSFSGTIFEGIVVDLERSFSPALALIVDLPKKIKLQLSII